jgi:hypothetical protein
MCKIGNIPKTMGVWMDINPIDIVIYSRKRMSEDEETIWDLISNGFFNFQIKLERKTLQVDEYEVINVNTREIQFRCENFQVILSIQDCFSFKTTKRII